MLGNYLKKKNTPYAPPAYDFFQFWFMIVFPPQKFLYTANNKCFW